MTYIHSRARSRARTRNRSQASKEYRSLVTSLTVNGDEFSPECQTTRRRRTSTDYEDDYEHEHDRVGYGLP
jgi:hypothetical protein